MDLGSVLSCAGKKEMESAGVVGVLGAFDLNKRRRMEPPTGPIAPIPHSKYHRRDIYNDGYG
jgi:hypothetical protein